MTGWKNGCERGNTLCTRSVFVLGSFPLYLPAAAIRAHLRHWFHRTRPLHVLMVLFYHLSPLLAKTSITPSTPRPWTPHLCPALTSGKKTRYYFTPSLAHLIPDSVLPSSLSSPSRGLPRTFLSSCIILQLVHRTSHALPLLSSLSSSTARYRTFYAHPLTKCQQTADPLDHSSSLSLVYPRPKIYSKKNIKKNVENVFLICTVVIPPYQACSTSRVVLIALSL